MIDMLTLLYISAYSGIFILLLLFLLIYLVLHRTDTTITSFEHQQHLSDQVTSQKLEKLSGLINALLNKQQQVEDELVSGALRRRRLPRKDAYKTDHLPIEETPTERVSSFQIIE